MFQSFLEWMKEIERCQLTEADNKNELQDTLSNRLYGLYYKWRVTITTMINYC